jgi:hypothetical protein
MIRAKRVRAPDGTVWTIRRRWAPRPRWRRLVRLPKWTRQASPPKRDRFRWLDALELLDLAELAFWLIVIAVVLSFMIFVGIPLIVFLFESLLIVPVGLVAGVIGRVLFRRPWTIEAVRTASGERRIAWNVVGWRASSVAADRMASAIRGLGEVASQPGRGYAAPRAHRRLAR